MKICFYTGNRGEFSLIKPLIEKLNKNKFFNTQILVSGSHLEKDFGETINEITKAGLKVDFQTSQLSRVNNNFQTAFQISESIKESSIGIDKLKPDFLVIYGDTFFDIDLNFTVSPGDKILVFVLFILKSSNGVLPIIFHPPGLSNVYIVQNFSTIPTEPLLIFIRGVSNLS